jgi:hypothetical protein
VEETSGWLAKIPYLIFRKTEGNVAKLPMTTFCGLSTCYFFVVTMATSLGNFLLGIPSLPEARRRSSGFSAYSQGSNCSSYYATPMGN